MALNLLKFDPELHANLKILAAVKRTTIGKLVEELLKQAIEQNQKETKS